MLIARATTAAKLAGGAIEPIKIMLVFSGEPYDGKLSRTVRERGRLISTLVHYNNLSLAIARENLNFQPQVFHLTSVLGKRGFSSLHKVRNFSSSSLQVENTTIQQINPYFITGFCDGECYFTISVYKSDKMKNGFFVKLTFGIGLHNKDKSLLEAIQYSLGGIGYISKLGKDAMQFRVSSVKDLEVIMTHFDNFPLITQKFSDYLLFKQALLLVKHKKHLTSEGIQELVAIKASMNTGISEEFKTNFPGFTQVMFKDLRTVHLNQ